MLADIIRAIRHTKTLHPSPLCHDYSYIRFLGNVESYFLSDKEGVDFFNIMITNRLFQNWDEIFQTNNTDNFDILAELYATISSLKESNASCASSDIKQKIGDLLSTAKIAFLEEAKNKHQDKKEYWQMLESSTTEVTQLDDSIEEFIQKVEALLEENIRSTDILKRSRPKIEISKCAGTLHRFLDLCEKQDNHVISAFMQRPIFLEVTALRDKIASSITKVSEGTRKYAAICLQNQQRIVDQFDTLKTEKENTLSLPSSPSSPDSDFTFSP